MSSKQDDKMSPRMTNTYFRGPACFFKFLARQLAVVSKPCVEGM